MFALNNVKSNNAVVFLLAKQNDIQLNSAIFVASIPMPEARRAEAGRTCIHKKA